MHSDDDLPGGPEDFRGSDGESHYMAQKRFKRGHNKYGGPPVSDRIKLVPCEVEGCRGLRGSQGGYLEDCPNRDSHPPQLTFDALRDANRRRCESVYHPIAAWSLTDWMTAVAGEVGELAEELEPYPATHAMAVGVTKAMGNLASAIKNVRRKHTDVGPNGHAIGAASRERIGDEAADVVIYLDLLLDRIGVDLGEAVRRKFNAVSDRTGTDIKL